jgi:tetratricopeptide (TPR) repeat protein
LSEESVRLISIVGRGGMGKTALACRVLADLEQGVLPVPGEDREITVDGILYLNARSTGLSLDRIYADVGRMVDEPAADRLKARWTNPDTPLAAKIECLLQAMQGGLYLILLDNLEDYFTEGHIIGEDGLRTLIECCLTKPTGARWILTSREQVNVVGAGLHNVRVIPLLEGLPEDESVSLLRDLDPQGELYLRHAAEADLRRAARSTSGIPRALEIVAGILHRDPTTTLGHLLGSRALFGEQVVERLVAEGYRRLKEDERRVMEALAVLDRPVKEDAIAYLLAPWSPELDVRHSLRELANSYFARANRTTQEYSLHPLDCDYARGWLPEDAEQGIYGRQSLELRAADFYSGLRKPENEWNSIEDLSPQLFEFEHRVRAKDYEGACRLLRSIESDYLSLWGHNSQLVELHKALRSHLVDPVLRAENASGLGLAYFYLGQTRLAITLYEQALPLFQRVGDRENEYTVLGRLGRAYRTLGEFEEAIAFHTQALGIARELGDGQAAAMLLDRLGVAYRRLGQIQQAREQFEKALNIARETGDQRGETRYLGNLGSVYRELGKPGQAEQYHRKAIVAVQEMGYRREEAIWTGSLGLDYRAQGRSEEAFATLEHAVSIAHELGDRRNEGLFLGRLGILCWHRGYNRSAVRYCTRALACSQETSHSLGTSLHSLWLSKALLVAGDLEKAKLYCEKACDLNIPLAREQALLTLGLVLLHQHNQGACNAFADAAAGCRRILDSGEASYEVHYALAEASAGMAVCNLGWAQTPIRIELLGPATQAYHQALSICSAKGVVQDAIRDLELIRAAGIEGLEPVFDLLEGAIGEGRG